MEVVNNMRTSVSNESMKMIFKSTAGSVIFSISTSVRITEVRSTEAC